MAVIVRRTFEQLRDEALQRMGKNDPVADLVTRMEQVMTSAYYDLAMTFHHYELHTEVSTPLTAASFSITIPDNLFVAMIVELADAQGTVKLDTLTHEHLYILTAKRDFASSGAPKEYARSAERLEFDLAADVDYTIDLTYYKQPDAPDFDPAASSSELEWLWDEYILQHTLGLFWPAMFRFDFSQVAMQTLAQFLPRQVQPPLQVGIRDYPERPLADEAVGGAQ